MERGAELDIHRGLDSGLSGPVPDIEDIYYQFSNKASEDPEMAALLWNLIDVNEIIERKYLRPMRFLMEGAAAAGYEGLFQRFLAVDWADKHTIDHDAWLHHLSLCLSKAVNSQFINIVRFMLDNGADPNGVHPSEIHEIEEDGVPPVLEAIRRENIEMVKLLLENGADPNPSGEPTWPTAFEECTSKPTISDVMLEIIQLLIDKDCLAEPRNSEQGSLISQSVNGGEKVFEMVRCHI